MDDPNRPKSGGIMGGSASQGTDGQKPAYLMPQGLSAVILAISLFFAITSLGVVSLRIWIRGRANILGWDDYFMAVGLALFLVAAGMASYDTFQGLGTPTKLIDDDMEIVGLKLFYMVSLVFIKNSICITLLRIAIQRAHRWALYITVALSTAVGLVGFIGMLSVCRPIQAQWEGGGDCAPRSTVVILNYTISAGAIVTDWACAIIPACILWNAQMKRNVKLSVGIVLGLGSLASLSTIIRIPYLRYYNELGDFLCECSARSWIWKAILIYCRVDKVGNIVLWSVLEGGIGLIAGSLPMLRQFFKGWLGSTVRSTAVGPSQLATIGGTQRKHSVSRYSKTGNPPPYSVRGSRIRDDRDWARLDDSGTDLHHLHNVPEHSDSQYELSELGRRDAAGMIRDLEKSLEK